MALLKKIKGATLVETLVASSLIVLVFLIASLSFNNIFQGVAKNNDRNYQNRIKELTYLSYHQKIQLPFEEETPQWNITIVAYPEGQLLEGTYKPNPAKDFEKIIVTHEK